MTAAELFAAGQLSQAVTAALDEVKRKPTDFAARWRLAEFASLQGDLERAEKQLQALLTQFPDKLISIMLFRNLLRGEQARRDVASEGRVPEFLTEPTDALRASLAALVALRGGDGAEAAKQVAAAEAARQPLAGQWDGEAFDDLRDLDDVFGPVLEFITSDGKCAWLPLEHIVWLKMEPPARATDLIWRQADLMVHGGQRTKAFLPMIYPETHREAHDALKLGRATEWKDAAPGVVRGIGQRMWLVGDEQRSLLEVKNLTITPPKKAGGATAEV
jgi:type VI secretion system protein ImpE